MAHGLLATTFYLLRNKKKKPWSAGRGFLGAGVAVGRAADSEVQAGARVGSSCRERDKQGPGKLTLRRRQGSQEKALFLVALALDIMSSDGLNSQSQVVALLARRCGKRVEATGRVVVCGRCVCVWGKTTGE